MEDDFLAPGQAANRFLHAQNAPVVLRTNCKSQNILCTGCGLEQLLTILSAADM